MVLISYVKPYILIQSNELISGHMTILGKDQKVLWEDDFSDKDFLSVKVHKNWKDGIKIIVATKHHKIKKELII